MVVINMKFYNFIVRYLIFFFFFIFCKYKNIVILFVNYFLIDLKVYYDKLKGVIENIMLIIIVVFVN